MGAMDDVLAGFNVVQGIKKSNSENAARDLNYKQAQIQADQLAGQTKALQDPNSAESKVTKAQGIAYLQGLSGTGLYRQNPGALDDLKKIISDPTTTGFQVHQVFEQSPIMKSLTGLGEAQAKAMSMEPLAQARMAGVMNQQDRIAANAADHFDKDPILTKINKQRQQIDLDKHTLNNPDAILTPQLINEVQQGIANAISGGGSAGLGKTEQVEMHTAAQKIAEIKQKLTSDPTAVKDPALIQYFQGTLERLGNAYDKNGYARAQQIFQGRSKGYKSNPAAIDVMKDKVDSYKPAEAVTPVSAPSAEDQAAVQWAQANKSDPRAQQILKLHGMQ